MSNGIDSETKGNILCWLTAVFCLVFVLWAFSFIFGDSEEYNLKEQAHDNAYYDAKNAHAYAQQKAELAHKHGMELKHQELRKEMMTYGYAEEVVTVGREQVIIIKPTAITAHLLLGETDIEKYKEFKSKLKTIEGEE